MTVPIVIYPSFAALRIFIRGGVVLVSNHLYATLVPLGSRRSTVVAGDRAPGSCSAQNGNLHLTDWQVSSRLTEPLGDLLAVTNGLIVKDLTDDCIGAVFERHGEARSADAAQLEVIATIEVLSRDAYAWHAVER